MRRLLLPTLAALLVIAGPAQADITVNTRDDVNAPADGLCSLREAVAPSPAECGTGTIHLPGGAPYPLNTILPLPGGTRIEATRAIVEAAATPHRLLHVGTGQTVYLSGLTVRGGTASNGAGHGGGILNFGNLTLVKVTVAGNTTVGGAHGTNGTAEGAAGGAGFTGGEGAGIYNEPSGTMTIFACTISGNTAGQGGDGGDGGVSGAGNKNGGAGGRGGNGGDGGGIFNAGTMTVTDTTITGNVAGAGGPGGLGQAGSSNGSGGVGGSGGNGGDGGGIATTGPLTITRSTIAGNRAGRGGDGVPGGNGGSTGGAGGGGGNAGEGGHGGGIFALATIAAISPTVTNATIVGNTGGRGGNGGNGGAGGGALGPGGNGGSGGDGQGGGGVWVGDDVRITLGLTHATIADNQGGAGGIRGLPGSGGSALPGSPGGGGYGGAISLSAGTVNVRNTIFSVNGIADDFGGCYGDTPTDLGGNVSFASRGCDGFPRNPKLGPLARNGGATKTMGLRAGSPAVDLIPPTGAGCAATDQRSVKRPVGGRCDAGAFEGVLPATQPGGALGSPKWLFKPKRKRLVLTYAVSGPGLLKVAVYMTAPKKKANAAAAKRVRIARATVHPSKAGNVKVTVKLARRALRAVKARGKLRVTTAATFTPTGGTPVTKTKRLTLRKR